MGRQSEETYSYTVDMSKMGHYGASVAAAVYQDQYSRLSEAQSWHPFKMESFDSEEDSDFPLKESLPFLYVDCHGGFSSVEDSVTSLSAIDRAEEGLHDSLRHSRLQRALAPGQILTQADIQRLYHEQNLGHFAVPVICILKLSLAMISFGQSAADTEEMVFQVCTAMELPVVHFEVGTRNITASFAGIVHTVPFARGINADKLASTISLANLMMMRVGSIQGASDLLDDIFEHRPPYSSFVHCLSFCALSILASIAAFMGSSRDAAAVSVIAPVAVLVQLFCRFSRFSQQWADLEAFLVALNVGILAPLAANFLEAPLCEIPAIYLSPLLVYLPGSQLIYGAYEIQFGSLVNGVSQLGSCIVRCMFLAMALLIGWQCFGHDFYQGRTSSSAAASLVPVNMCMFPYSWEVVFYGWNIPLLFFAFIGLNMPLCKMAAPGLIAYMSLLLYIVLLEHPSVKGFFPARIIDSIALFATANLAYLYEYCTSSPAILAILPVLLVLAPGSHVVLSILSSVQRSASLSVMVEPILDLILQGVAYAVGLALAMRLWRPLLHRKLARRLARTMHMY